MGLEFAGKTFGGYRVGDVLDSGPHGALYAAEHTGSGDKVAIKIFAVDLSRDKNAAQRVVSEVQRASAVTHPNVVPVREVGTAEFKGKRHLFVAMDRLHGESLKSLIAKQKGQPLPLKQALHILSEVGAALEAIHRSNGVHRQLTSSAIFVAAGEAEPDESRIVVLDLGAALVPIGDDKKAKVGGKLQDDLRALAQLAYEMLAGNDASTEPGQALLPLRLRNRAVPARMDAVLRSVLGDALGTGDKGSRYDSAAAFVAALLGTGETQPIYASWSEDGRTFPAARKSHSTLLWAGLFAIAGGLALGYHLYSSEPTTQPGVNTPPKPPTPIVDQAGPVTPPTSSSAADAGADAGPARTPGPGHWPQRPGGKLPEVRAADAWPTPPATPSSTASPTPSPSPAAGASPAGVKDAAATGQPPPAAKPTAATATATPAGNAASPAKPTATPTAGSATPTASPAAKPTAPAAAPGDKAAAPSSTPAAKPAAAPTTGTATPPSPVKPTGGATAAPSTTAPAAKAPTPGSGAAATPSATQKPAAPAGTTGSAPPPTAKPTAAAGAPTGSTASAAAPAAKAAAGSTPTSTGPAAARPAVPGTATPGSTAPATAAKPAAASSGASPTAPKSSSAPAASTGAASAAKTPETRPSSTGSSAPAAKPATNSGGASGPQ